MSKIETIVEVTSSDKFKNATRVIESDIQEAYLETNIPWIVCFSGGKDSTALLQLVFSALSKLPQERLVKEFHVLSNDTLVENPTIAQYLDLQLEHITRYGKKVLYRHNPDLFSVEKGKPVIEDRFWVNLIGRGYPSPNRFFRWCTDRLKIKPTNNYIEDMLRGSEKVIILLGTRKDESANRSRSMKRYEGEGRYHNHTLPKVLVYTPIADLSNNDVWAYLLQTDNPWGSNAMGLLDMYGHASSGGECPFVIETGTQSCGKSRFGCWVCTVIDRDRSMENFISNGADWMQELLVFRNWLYEIRQQSSQYVPSRLKSRARFSSFLISTRKKALDKLLETQKKLNIALIEKDELDLVQKLLEAESGDGTKGGLKQFIYELPKGRNIAVISDFDISKTERKRLGALDFRQAKLVKTSETSSRYDMCTRVIYYEVRKSSGKSEVKNGDD